MRDRIAKRLLLAVALVVLVLPGVARAHVTVLPNQLEAGKRSTIVLTSPNERPGHALVDFTATFPRGVELASAPPPAGWHLTVTGNSARWSGGRIAPGEVTEFRIAARTESPPGATTLYASQRYDDGKSVRWEIPFTILPASNSPTQHLWRAVFAAAAGFVLVVGGLVIVRRRKS